MSQDTTALEWDVEVADERDCRSMAQAARPLHERHSFMVVPFEPIVKNTTLQTYADLAERQIAIVIVAVELIRQTHT